MFCTTSCDLHTLHRHGHDAHHHCGIIDLAQALLLIMVLYAYKASGGLITAEPHPAATDIVARPCLPLAAPEVALLVCHKTQHSGQLLVAVATVLTCGRLSLH